MSELRDIARVPGRSRAQEPSSAMLAGLKRMVIRAGLHARATIGEAAQKVANACGAQPDVTGFPNRDSAQHSEDFADLPAYKNILKHKEIGLLFGIQDPFYRCHDARRRPTVPSTFRVRS